MSDLSPCCGAYTTWGDDGLFCKKCYEPVNPVDVLSPPRAEDALTFDEVEAAGLDGTLRDIEGGTMKRTPEQMVDAYIELCVDNGFDGNTGPNGDWGDCGDSDHFDNPVDIVDEPIVLIEHSQFGQTWITLHSTLEAACKANTNQEYAEDWAFPTIIDIAHDRYYEVEYKAMAVPIRKEA